MENKDFKVDPEKAKKDKYMKMGIIGFTLVVVIGAVVLMGQTEYFSGWFKFKPPSLMRVTKPVTRFPFDIYKNNDTPPKPVSVVVSPVPTVVASPVPSQVGPSIVVSQVPSTVVTPVASGVPLSAVSAAKVNMGSLKQLSSQILKTMAKEHMTRNPVKYTLTKEQKRGMIELYMRKLNK